MRILPHQTRLWLSALIIVSFIIPAYKSISAFTFIGLALSEVETHADVTIIDVLIVVSPLIFMPIIAIVIAIRSVRRVPVRKTVTALPLVLLVFFCAILSFSSNNSDVHAPLPGLLFDMQIGFYLTVIASLLLVFTKNVSKRRHKRRSRSSKITNVEAVSLNDD
jgi:hypothetical protein